jgi:UDP-N-acetylglucosamine--N-acetylmuramyl-(pentapeptide) pyrophosphoryl-undecaprenol N-acetylglucosamine transferase
MPLRKVIISGGGTGGHIFPAIAIANELKKQDPTIEILFVGAIGKMEMEKVPAAGYKIEGLWISGLQRKLTVKNLSFPFKVISSLLRARKILRQFKPDAVIGVGGFASGPMLRAAAGKGIPTIIQEQNSYPGITNKILSKKVRKICVAYEGLEKWFPKEKIVLTGNPVREEIVKLEGKRERGLEHFGLNTAQSTLLIIGGSLGARTINEAIELNLSLLKENNIQVIWQTGKGFFERAKQAASSFDNVKVFDFIAKMDLAYAVADVVVSRAGAISVSELCLVKKPCILIPSPNVAEDHQTKNAMALVNHHAAVLVKDIEAKEKLGETLKMIFSSQDEQNKLRNNIASLGFNNSTQAIVAVIKETVR